MKKVFAFLLAMMMVFALTACGSSEANEEIKNDGDKPNAEEIAEELIEEAEELDSFSEAAVEYFLKAYGIAYDDLKPDWEYEVGEKSAYADDPSSGSGHAVVIFKNTNGEVSDEQIREFYEQVFNVTAAVSDDGYNINGFEFVGDGENPEDEIDLDDALNGFMSGWCFRKDGKNMAVYVSDIYDNNKESEFDRLFYYYGVKFDIGVGLQKSFDEVLSDVEDAFEEYGDEIEEVLENYE